MENCLNPTTKWSQKRELVTRLLDDKYIASYYSDYFDINVPFQNFIFRETTTDGRENSTRASAKIDTVNVGADAYIITDFFASRSGLTLDGNLETNSRIELSVLQKLNTMVAASLKRPEPAHVDGLLDMPRHYNGNTNKSQTSRLGTTLM